MAKNKVEVWPEEGLLFEKWVHGVPLSRKAKRLAANLMINSQELNPIQTLRNMYSFCSNLMGVSIRTLKTVRTELKNTGTLASASGKVRSNRINKGTRLHKFDEVTLSKIRRVIHGLLDGQEGGYPTMGKITSAVNADKNLPNFTRTSMYRLVYDLKFSFDTPRRKNTILFDDLAECRRKYLRRMRECRSANREIVYVDETWITCERELSSFKRAPSSGKDERWILLHAGGKNGLVPGCVCIFPSEKSNTGYYQELDGPSFESWFRVCLLPNIGPCSVIVLDDAACHTATSEPMPTASWTTDAIRTWLTSKGLRWRDDMIKTELLGLAEHLRDSCGGCTIEILAREAGHEILRQPPYHSELNPMEQVWAFVKDNLARRAANCKPDDLPTLTELAVAKVTPEMWRKYMVQTTEEEESLWRLDMVLDDIMDRAIADSERDECLV